MSNDKKPRWPEIICDVIIDFKTTKPENDIKVAQTFLCEFEEQFNLEPGSFKLDPPKEASIGWSFAKLFLSLEIAQKLYETNSYEIDNFYATGRSYKFVAWLNSILIKRGCQALLEFADEMKNTSGGSRYGSQIVGIFSDEFSYIR